MRTYLTTCCAVLASLCLALPCSAEVKDALQIELRELTADISKIVNKNGGGSIAIGEFTGSVEVQGHTGPGLQLVLAEELKKAGLNVVSEKHDFEVTGRYQPFHAIEKDGEIQAGDPNTEDTLLGVKLNTFLIERKTGDFLANLTARVIFGTEAVPGMLGLNTSNKPSRDVREISKRNEDALKHPQADVRGTKLTGKSGDYAIEVLLKQNGKYVAQPIDMRDNTPFVDLHTSAIYGIRIINNSKHDAAVDLRIDGVNCFAFSETGSKYWILDPNSHLDVIGWHKTREKSIEFKVVDNFPDTAAAKLNLRPSSTIGLISVFFSACWENESDRPADEQNLASRGTGFGSEVTFKTQKVQRTIGQLRDTLSVRYEK